MHLDNFKSETIRQTLHDIMKKMNYRCWCIRCREARKIINEPVLRVISFDSFEGKEFFISAVDSEDIYNLYGFCRLRFDPHGGCNLNNRIIFNSLFDAAMIRELHVYGFVNSNMSESVENSTISRRGLVQGRGIGKMLVNEAIRIAKEYGFSKMSVIAGEGVRKYYEKFNFINDTSTYMIKHF